MPKVWLPLFFFPSKWTDLDLTALSSFRRSFSILLSEVLRRNFIISDERDLVDSILSRFDSLEKFCPDGQFQLHLTSSFFVRNLYEQLSCTVKPELTTTFLQRPLFCGLISNFYNIISLWTMTTCQQRPLFLCPVGSRCTQIWL